MLKIYIMRDFFLGFFRLSMSGTDMKEHYHYERHIINQINFNYRDIQSIN
jgi:hypothetical protein